MNQYKLHITRQDFPALEQRRNGTAPVYFDNACTTLVPRQVITSLHEYYERYPGCGGGRSRHWFSHEVVSRIEGDEDTGAAGSRDTIRRFINARSRREIIFTLNTSHAINMVALGFPFNEGDVVILSDREHNSNLLPWLRLEKQGRITVDSIPTQLDDTFDFDVFEEKLRRPNVRLVSMAFTSNLTGATLPAREIIAVAHRYGARVLLDAAQTVPHQSVNVQDLDVDFMAFSLHKMCGPKGIGVLYGKEELLGNQYHEKDEAQDVIVPAILGGGTVGDSLDHDYYLLDPPDRFETGIQNYPAQIAAGTAINYLEGVGMGIIRDHLAALNRHITKELLKQYGDTGWFRILGPADPVKRSGIITFEITRPNAMGIAEELDARANIMVRDGDYCVHTYFNRVYGHGWSRPHLPSEHRMTYRISLYLYNTIEECDLFLETLHDILTERSYI